MTQLSIDLIRYQEILLELKVVCDCDSSLGQTCEYCQPLLDELEELNNKLY